MPDAPYPRTNSREEMLERIAAANEAPGKAPPTPEAMAAMAKAHLKEQREAAFAELRPRTA